MNILAMIANYNEPDFKKNTWVFPLSFGGQQKTNTLGMVEIYIFVPTGPARPGKQPSYLWSSGGKLPRVNVVYCILEVIVLARGPVMVGWLRKGWASKHDDPKNSEAMWTFGGVGVNLGLGVKS